MYLIKFHALQGYTIRLCRGCLTANVEYIYTKCCVCMYVYLIYSECMVLNPGVTCAIEIIHKCGVFNAIIVEL